MKVLLTHPGTQYSHKLAEQLEKQGILFCFATGLAFGKDSRLLKLLPAWLRKKLQRRQVLIPGAKIASLPLLELNALRRLRNGVPPETVFADRNRAFQQRIPQHLIDGADIVIGFDTSSLLLQERCRKAGKPFIMDASIAHPISQRRVFEQLRTRFPAWSAQLEPKDPRLIEQEIKEMEGAGAIVVASQFTRNTYLYYGVQAAKIHINHYGTDFSYFRSKWEHTTTRKTGPVRFLFFSKLSVRKGFPWLCEAWKDLHQQYPDTLLLAAGYGALPAGFEVPAGVTIRGFVHPSDRLELLHSADVFVFPSYFEGFAQVIIEAMACGLPVITTTATVGPEIITNGQEGFCIEPGDDQALADAMEYFLLHRENIAPMGRKARARSESLTWDAYGERWNRICRSLISDL